MKYILLTIAVIVSFGSRAQNVYPSSGYVGIGTTTPGFKLDIINESGVPQNLFRVKVNGAPTDEFKIINATGVSGQFIPAITGYHDSDNREVIGLMGVAGISNDVGSNPVVFFDARHSGGAISNRPLFGWDSYGNRKMTLSASGNLGIGLASSLPSRLNLEAATGGEQIRMSRGTGVVRFAQDYNKDALYLFNGNASLTYMCWKENGNVGVGTQNPDAKLAVKGTVHAEEVKVDLSVPGPDYVFEEDYQLQSLEEIESYVKANKHLPDVPSASEMEAEGIKVGEMNMILLRKVEELTLHLIKQNQLIIHQQSEIDELKSKLK